MPGDPPPVGTPWMWTGPTNGTYGRFGAERRYFSAHIASYLIFNGPIPAGLHIRHTTDIPLDVNPNHLILGTPKDNAVDRSSRNRTACGEKQGKSIFTEDNIRAIRIIAMPAWERRMAESGYKGMYKKQYDAIAAFLAEKYRCNPKTIYHLLKGGWKHVE